MNLSTATEENEVLRHQIEADRERLVDLEEENMALRQQVRGFNYIEQLSAQAPFSPAIVGSIITADLRHVYMIEKSQSTSYQKSLVSF